MLFQYSVPILLHSQYSNANFEDRSGKPQQPSKPPPSHLLGGSRKYPNANFEGPTPKIAAKSMPKRKTDSDAVLQSHAKAHKKSAEFVNMSEIEAKIEANMAKIEADKCKIDAKNALENYCFQGVDVDELKHKFEGGYIETVEKAVQETLHWLDKNQLAEKEEFEAKQQELQDVVDFCFAMGNTLQEAKLKWVKFEGDDLETAEKALQKTLDWQDNQLAVKEEFEAKQELEVVKLKVILINDKIDAKNALENYCLGVDVDKFEGAGVLLQKAVEETLGWIDKNQLAEKEEFEAKREELAGVVNLYRFAMGNTLQEAKLKVKFEGDDLETAEKALQKTLDWQDNQLAVKEEFEAKQELEVVMW